MRQQSPRYIVTFIAMGFSALSFAQVSQSRLVAVDSFTIKCTSVTTGSAANFSLAAGNSSANANASGPESLDVSNPEGFSGGLGEILKSVLTETKGWIVVDLPAPSTSGTVTVEGTAKPQFLIRATVVDMNVSSGGGGLNLGALGGGQKQIRNKVTLDVKLVDPTTQVVLETVRSVGTKTTKSNFMGVYDKDDKKLFGWDAFQESPLAEAADLAIKDGVRKLGEKMKKYPWEAEIASIQKEKGVDAIYLNVGSDCGLKLGQELELFIPGALIIDQKTGHASGRARPTIVGKVRVTDVESDLIVVQAIANVTVEAGMHVRLLKEVIK